jgi:hypothetical protein
VCVFVCLGVQWTLLKLRPTAIVYWSTTSANRSLVFYVLNNMITSFDHEVLKMLTFCPTWCTIRRPLGNGGKTDMCWDGRGVCVRMCVCARVRVSKKESVFFLSAAPDVLSVPVRTRVNFPNANVAPAREQSQPLITRQLKPLTSFIALFSCCFGNTE